MREKQGLVATASQSPVVETDRVYDLKARVTGGFRGAARGNVALIADGFDALSELVSLALPQTPKHKGGAGA